MSFGIKRNFSPGQCFEKFLENYFVSPSCQIIRRFELEPIYTNIIVTIVVA